MVTGVSKCLELRENNLVFAAVCGCFDIPLTLSQPIYDFAFSLHFLPAWSLTVNQSWDVGFLTPFLNMCPTLRGLLDP